MGARIAIAHDYLTQRGGAERVVLALARIWPDAPIYTTLFEPSTTYPEFAGLDVRVSPLNRVTVLRHHHRAALPLLPSAVRSLRIDADVVIASSSGWAHGVPTSGRKIVYCYSPARWLYQGDRYLGDAASPVRRGALALLGGPLRRWDRRAAASADEYLAISRAVQDRIAAAYRRGSRLLPAPHSMDPAASQEPVIDPETGREPEPGYFLCLSRLLPYKHVDRVVEAARERDARLVVVGAGPEEARLRGLAGRGILVLRDLTDAQLRRLYARCLAVVSASHEDFGLTPLEGAAFGRPSVVLRWGGFLDTVVDGVTGVFVDEPTAASIGAGLDAARARAWDADRIRAHSARFGEDAFAQRMRDAVAEQLAAPSEGRRIGAAA
jgi:glycosyltransferase involved in cell wall biosynthesis